MIFRSTINTLSEEELSILYLIIHNALGPFGIEPRLDFIKMFRLDILLRIIDVLKPQALPDKQDIFDSLKKKLTE